jgi:hypothetical protein
MQKWEYKVVSHPREDELNALGNEGWEMVAIDEYLTVYLKRPKNKF